MPRRKGRRVRNVGTGDRRDCGKAVWVVGVIRVIPRRWNVSQGMDNDLTLVRHQVPHGQGRWGRER